jgi:hypothetical protein
MVYPFNCGRTSTQACLDFGSQNHNCLLINLLKPTGYVMHQCTLCPHSIYVFCIYLRTNSDLCHLQHKLIGFYNPDEKCLQRGTDWGFKYSSLRFVFKGLMYLERCTSYIMNWASGIRKLALTCNKTYIVDVHLAEVL